MAEQIPHSSAGPVQAGGKEQQMSSAAENNQQPRGFRSDMEIEKIIALLLEKKRLAYWIKWKGTNKIDTVPTKEANVKFPQAVLQFYKTAYPSDKVEVMDSDNLKEKLEKSRGSNPNFVPDKITKVIKVDGEIYFWMKWKMIDAEDLIHREEACVKYAQVVIKFYEQSMKELVFPGFKFAEQQDESEDEEPRPYGFARNLEPEKILCLNDRNEEKYFLIKWKGADKIDMVPTKEANVKCPQLVIQFYRNGLFWRKIDSKEILERTSALRDLARMNTPSTSCDYRSSPRFETVTRDFIYTIPDQQKAHCSADPVSVIGEEDQIWLVAENDQYLQKVRNFDWSGLTGVNYKIITAVAAPRGILFLIKWEGIEGLGLVIDRIAYVEYTQAVIQFFEGIVEE